MNAEQLADVRFSLGSVATFLARDEIDDALDACQDALDRARLYGWPDALVGDEPTRGLASFGDQDSPKP